MCLVVDYSKKLVKSDYFGVIICNWWRKVRKLAYSLSKMLISIQITTKTPNIRDFRHNNSKFDRVHAEYTKNSGYSMRFFRKIGKICINWYKINHISNNLGRKLRKIGIFTKTGTNSHVLFLQTTVCGYILAQLSKQLFFHIKIRWKSLII